MNKDEVQVRRGNVLGCRHRSAARSSSFARSHSGSISPFKKDQGMMY